ncbi:MAG: hypothetical protein QNJ97_12610 [Myxococcota bacterium]|nr:hypothetical protein [Myxococcota bacterium]
MFEPKASHIRGGSATENLDQSGGRRQERWLVRYFTILRVFNIWRVYGIHMLMRWARFIIPIIVLGIGFYAIWSMVSGDDQDRTRPNRATSSERPLPPKQSQPKQTRAKALRTLIRKLEQNERSDDTETQSNQEPTARISRDLPFPEALRQLNAVTAELKRAEPLLSTLSASEQQQLFFRGMGAYDTALASAHRTGGAALEELKAIYPAFSQVMRKLSENLESIDQ